MSYDGYVKRKLLHDSSIASNLAGFQDPMDWLKRNARLFQLNSPVKS